MLQAFKRWKLARVRAIESRRRNFYVRFTPNVGFCVPWFSYEGKPRRVRWSFHHGLQIVLWRGARWTVQKQILGKSKVKKESFEHGAIRKTPS